VNKRPNGVWLICAYIAWTSMSSLVGISYAFLSSDPGAQWGRDYYLSLNAWQITYVLFNALLALSAGIALFLMRRIAAPLFTGVLVLGIGNSIWQVSSGWIADRGVDAIGWGGVIVALLLGLVLIGAIVSYVWWLRIKGRLS